MQVRPFRSGFDCRARRAARSRGPCSRRHCHNELRKLRRQSHQGGALARLNALRSGRTSRRPVDCWWRASRRSAAELVAGRCGRCARRYRDGRSVTVVGWLLLVEFLALAGSRLAGTRSDVLAAPIVGLRKQRTPQRARWSTTATAIGFKRS